MPSDLDALVLLQQYQQKDLTKGRLLYGKSFFFSMGRRSWRFDITLMTLLYIDELKYFYATVC